MGKVGKRRILNYLSVLGKVTLKIQMRKRRKALVKRKRLKYVTVGERFKFIK